MSGSELTGLAALSRALAGCDPQGLVAAVKDARLAAVHRDDVQEAVRTARRTLADQGGAATRPAVRRRLAGLEKQLGADHVDLLKLSICLEVLCNVLETARWVQHSGSEDQAEPVRQKLRSTCLDLTSTVAGLFRHDVFGGDTTASPPGAGRGTGGDRAPGTGGGRRAGTAGGGGSPARGGTGSPQRGAQTHGSSVSPGASSAPALPYQDRSPTGAFAPLAALAAHQQSSDVPRPPDQTLAEQPDTQAANQEGSHTTPDTAPAGGPPHEQVGPPSGQVGGALAAAVSGMPPPAWMLGLPGTGFSPVADLVPEEATPAESPGVGRGLLTSGLGGATGALGAGTLGAGSASPGRAAPITPVTPMGAGAGKDSGVRRAPEVDRGTEDEWWGDGWWS